jgi:hypothetical protein
MPYYRSYGPMWGTPPMVPRPNFNYNYQGNQAPSASQGKQKTPVLLKNSAPPESKKRKVAEVALGSQPKVGSGTAVSRLLRLASKTLERRLHNYRLPRV